MHPPLWSFLDAVAAVTSCVVAMLLGFPAYKRTKRIGFLVWCWAALGGLWNTILLHTIGADPHRNPAGYLFVHQSHRVLYIVDTVLGVIGTVLVVKGYLALFESRASAIPVSGRD